MVSAIGGFSNYMATSGIFNTQKATSPQEDLRELSSVASSYYSISDTVEPLKTSTESDSRWLYQAVNNELGMPSGIDIDGMAETPAKITVNLNGVGSHGSSTPNPTEAGAPQGGAGGASAAGGAGGAGGASGTSETEDESDDPMDLNGDGEVTIQEIQQYYAQKSDEAVSESLQSVGSNLNTVLEDNLTENNNLNSYKNKIQNFVQKAAASAYKQINQNYLNSYVA